MKNLFSDILRTKISAFAGKSLLLHFPAKGFFSFLISSFVSAYSNNGMVMSLQMVSSALNNQRNNQQFNQQQIRMT